MRKNFRKLIGTTLMLSASLGFCLSGAQVVKADTDGSILVITESMLIGDLDESGAYTTADLSAMNTEIRQYRNAVSAGNTYYHAQADMDCDDDLDYTDYAILKYLVNEVGYKYLGDQDGDHIYETTDATSLQADITGYIYGQAIGVPFYDEQSDLDCDGDIDEDDMALLENKIWTLGDVSGDGAIDSTDLHWMTDEIRGYSLYKSEGNYYYNYKGDMDADGDLDADDYTLLAAKIG